MVSVIIVAGGTGSRMKGQLPKQFVSVCGKPLIQYSLEAFEKVVSITEVIVVCSEEYRDLVAALSSGLPIRFANPGERRQDSVWNGLQEASSNAQLICVHDAARPLITPAIIERALSQARNHGAAVVGMPVRFTVKVSRDGGWVDHTPNRENIWEIQTPQVARRELLFRGFAKAQETGETVTDDVSLVELLGEPVKLVEGSWDNIKVTTPEDWPLVAALLGGRGAGCV